MSDEKLEELKEEMASVTVTGSSVRTKPGTDPDEAFADVESDDSEGDSEAFLSRLSRWFYSL